MISPRLPVFYLQYYYQETTNLYEYYESGDKYSKFTFGKKCNSDGVTIFELILSNDLGNSHYGVLENRGKVFNEEAAITTKTTNIANQCLLFLQWNKCTKIDTVGNLFSKSIIVYFCF